MARYHVNPETQKVGRCTAQIQCEFADAETGMEPIHFSNLEEANAYVEKKLAEEMEETPKSVSSSRKKVVKKKPKTYFNTIHPIRKGETLYGADNLPEFEKRCERYYVGGMHNYFEGTKEVTMHESTGTKHRFPDRDKKSFHLDDTFSNRALATQYFTTPEKTRIINKTGKPLYVCAFTRRRSVVTAPEDKFGTGKYNKDYLRTDRVFKIVDKKPRFLKKTDIIAMIDPE